MPLQTVPLQTQRASKEQPEAALKRVFLKVKTFKHACGALEDAEPCLALVEVAEVIAEVTEVNSLLQLIGHF